MIIDHGCAGRGEIDCFDKTVFVPECILYSSTAIPPFESTSF